MIPRRSLAWRLTASVIVAGGVVLGALFLWLHYAIEHELFSRFDAALLARARALADRVEARPVVTLDVGRGWPEYAAGGHQEFYQLWNAAGGVLARSASSRGADLARPPAGVLAPAFYDLPLPDGHRGRAVALSAWPAAADSDIGVARGPPHLLVVATEREALDALEQRLHVVLVLGILAALAIIVVFGVLAVRRGLAPLESFGRSLSARVAADALAASAPPGAPTAAPGAQVTALPAELIPIAQVAQRAIDDALAALRREQRFARVAAHELRTPLAEIRLIAQALPDAPAESEALLQVVDGMTRAVDTLLTLARCEAGIEVPALEPVDLAALVRQALARLASTAQQRDLVVAASLPVEAWTMSDAAMLERILANVLGNAVVHAPAATRLTVSLTGTGGQVALGVRNAAPGLDAARLEAAVRGELRAEARAHGPGHAGLGLLLAAALARQLGLELAVAMVADEVEVKLTGFAPVPGL